MKLSVTVRNTPTLIVVGPLCAGKTTFGEIARKRGMVVVEWGDFLSSLLPSRGVHRRDTYEAIVQMVADQGRIEFLAKLVRHIENALSQAQMKELVLVGPRNPVDLAYVMGLIRVRTVLLIDTDLSTRFSRVAARNRLGDPLTRLEFIRVEMKEYSSGLAHVILEFTNDVLDGNQSIERFTKSAESYIEDWLRRVHCTQESEAGPSDAQEAVL